MGKKDRRNFSMQKKIEILAKIDAYEAEGIVFAEACREVGVVNSVVRRWQAAMAQGKLSGSTDRGIAKNKSRAKKKRSPTAKMSDDEKMELVEQWVQLQDDGMTPEEAANEVDKHSTSLYKYRIELEKRGLREPRTKSSNGRDLPTEKKSPAAYAAGKKVPQQLLKVDGMCPNCGQAISL